MHQLDHDDFTSREAETLREHGYTTEHAIYDAVGNLYLMLNETELRLLVGQLNTSLAEYQSHALKLRVVRDELYRQYNVRSLAGRSTSVFSPAFNMSMKGHNEALRESVDRHFAAAAISDIRGRSDAAIDFLSKLGIRHNILFGSEITKLVTAHSPEGAAELSRIKQYRGVLFRTIIPLAAKIARNQAIPLKSTGTTLDFPDVLQEAFIAAMQTLENYKPISGGRTLTSYIFLSVNAAVSHRKAELGRNVYIPRIVSDRYTYVQKAATHLGITNLASDLTTDELTQLAVMASAITPASKGSFTPLEVLSLIEVMQSESSMNIETVDEDGSLVEFGDLIETPIDMDVEYDNAHATERLMKLIKPFTSPMEYELMEIRWGRDEVKNYAATASAYYDTHRTPMNKTVVANVEKEVFKRIRKECETNTDLQARFMQIWASLNLS